MPRPRSTENKGLPPRWRMVGGAYYYQVPVDQRDKWDGKVTFKLGDSLADAYRAWAERIGVVKNARTVAQLLDRYALEVVPTKGVLTQTEHRRAIVRLRGTFGDFAIEKMRPMYMYQYVENHKTPNQGRKEIKVFSHVYTKAVEWGLLDRHPFKGEVRLSGEKSRTRYVEDWELEECLAMPSRRKKGSVLMIQAYLRLKLLTGLRKGDLLRLQESHLKEDGIHTFPRKTANTTGKRQIIEWSPELEETVKRAREARPVESDYLFCNRYGECYFDPIKETASGWDSMWSRFMDRALEDTKLTIRFTEHDIRAKSASDAITLDHAKSLLSHADARLTDRVYRRKPERVKPLR